MKYLYLQENFRPMHNSKVAQNILLNDWLLNETRTWKGGEEHFKVLEIPPVDASDEITIVSRATSSSEVMRIVMAHDALQHIGFKHISLMLPYIPYARQDRVMNPGEPLSIKVFAKIINMCQFEHVHVLDPHSDVSVALIDNCNVLSDLYYDYVRGVITNIILTEELKKGKLVVISPDSGAYKKIFKTCENIQFKGEVVLCNKHRDLETNEISGIKVGGNVKGKTCVIIDDICDGGRTFAELGAALKEKGAEKVFLIVTHGIFSYGEDQIKGPNPAMSCIDHVWTTDSFRDIESDFITLVKLESLLN